VLERDGRDFTVHGRFSIELPRGVYRVSVDSCAHQQTIHIKHRISGLKLVPRCAIPL
jgi:hypothetical protein